MIKNFDEYFNKAFVAILAIILALFYFHIVPDAKLEIVFIIASVIGLIPVLISTVKSIIKRQVSVDLLASIALIAAMIAQEWSSVVFFNLMLTCARIFGHYTEGTVRLALDSLLKLRPQTAKIKREGKIMKIATNKIIVGDLVIVETGERISVDGKITEGDAEIDQSSLTGESVPVSKKIGDEAFSSTLNVGGSITILAERVGHDTTLERIVQMVEDSQKNKSKIRTMAEVFATWYIIITVGGAVIVYLITRDFQLVLSLLLVACADDIAIAIPLAFFAAIGYAARRGVIIKGSEFLEGLTHVKQILLDKTGTITVGKLKTEKAQAFEGFSENDLLIYAGEAEGVSAHPIASSIVEFVKSRQVEIISPSVFKETPGQGVEVSGDNFKIICGKISYLEQENVQFSEEQKNILSEQQSLGYTLVVVAYNGQPAGYFSLVDVIRPDIKEIIKRFYAMGVEKIVMLTGDNEKVAAKIAKQAGIKEFHANLLPQDKLDFIKKAISPKFKTIMIGDGVNDAAAISLADIGVSMGAIGSDSAIEASDIALMKDDLSELPRMITLGRYTTKIAKQNFIIWGAANAIGFTLVFLNILDPVGASIYNFLTDFPTLFNSMRLFTMHRHLKKDDKKGLG